ncbi:MAG TPA: vWA domain-containing protein, partial [Kofleriaceae bacterium]
MIELRCTLDRSRIPPDVATEVGCQLELRPVEMAAIQGSAALTTNLCLVLDCSASMLGAKVEAAIQAAKLIVSTIDARHRISVVGFATSHWVVVDNASPDETGRDAINAEIERLRTMIKGSTNLGEGIRHGIKMVQRQQADASVLVVLTDGVADSQADAEQASAEANQAGVQVFAVGIGEAFRADDLLKVVAPSGGSLLGERAADRLEAAFVELLERIESFVATGVQLDISPAAGVVVGAVYKTSPERMFIGDAVDHVIVGNLERGIAYSFHVALTPPCAGSGEAEIARATLRYNVPSRRLRGETTEVSIRIAYDGRAEVANPEVVRAQARAQLAAL